MGLWALFATRGNRQVRIALGLVLVGQLALHSVYSDHVFLSSIHFAPLLVVLAALSTLTRARFVTLMLAGALIVSAVVNNSFQFIRATEFLQCIL